MADKERPSKYNTKEKNPPIHLDPEFFEETSRRIKNYKKVRHTFSDISNEKGAAFNSATDKGYDPSTSLEISNVIDEGSKKGQKYSKGGQIRGWGKARRK